MNAVHVLVLLLATAALPASLKLQGMSADVWMPVLVVAAVAALVLAVLVELGPDSAPGGGRWNGVGDRKE